jgi:hypothetical protein
LEDTEFPPEFRQQALKLTKDEPLAIKPIVGDQAVYIISLKEKIPSELPPLEKIQEKVTADYKNSQAQDAARKAGAAFHLTLTNGLAQSKAFNDICAEVKVQTVSLPPFSSSTESLTNIDERINYRQVQRLAEDLQPNKASAFTPMPPHGGLILYLRARLPVDEAKVKTELPGFTGRLRAYRQNEAFQQWFRKQAEQARLIMPVRETDKPAPST